MWRELRNVKLRVKLLVIIFIRKKWNKFIRKFHLWPIINLVIAFASGKIDDLLVLLQLVLHLILSIFPMYPIHSAYLHDHVFINVKGPLVIPVLPLHHRGNETVWTSWTPQHRPLTSKCTGCHGDPASGRCALSFQGRWPLVGRFLCLYCIAHSVLTFSCNRPNIWPVRPHGGTFPWSSVWTGGTRRDLARSSSRVSC